MRAFFLTIVKVLALSDVAVMTYESVAEEVTTTVPGQDATITFAGTANQRVSWQWGTLALNPAGNWPSIALSRSCARCNCGIEPSRPIV